MADKNIGALPQAPQLDDDSLMIIEQQGQAMKMTGAQLKNYAKQGVELEFQEDLEASQAAADRAEDAVRAVEDMTVSAQTLDSGEAASVTKTKQGNVFHLAFGLPRGEQGIQGPEGQTGPRGPKGDPGSGLKVLGYYDTLTALEAAVPAPAVGDAYGVGTAAPYDIYVFDGSSNTWKNNGPFSGGGGGPLPENVVTAEGGAEMTFSSALGEAPYTMTITDEEEPPITASDVLCDDGKTVQETVDGLFTSVSDGKAVIASAITDKGVDTAQDATFQQMADNIGQITTGGDTSDATATPGDILAPKTAYTSSGKVEGIIPSLAAQTITPGTTDKTIANGQYLSGTQTIKGDPNLTSANIKNGVSIFGVNGALQTSFKANLTVTVDVGAVVTATHTNGTEVEALSTTGTVVLELPIEGKWTVTAVRGVAQYNSVVVTVSSSYSAALTAEVHIEYFGTISSLSESVASIGAISFSNRAILAGGFTGTSSTTSTVDSYNEQLTKLSLSPLDKSRGDISAATAIDYVIFSPGNLYEWTDAYSKSFDLLGPANFSTPRIFAMAASVGNYALFTGGNAYSGGYSNATDAYDNTLTHSTPTGLSIACYAHAGSSNENYAIFGGGLNASKVAAANVTAYNSTLTRTTPASLSVARAYLTATRAGNYVLFAGGRKNSSTNYATVDAYDLFLTRTTHDEMHLDGQHNSTTLKGFALFSDYYGIDCYDPFLVKTRPATLTVPRKNLGACSVGSYALFAGGVSDSGTYYNSVEAVHYA